MTLKERIILLKSGYTKKEIEELAKAEAEAVVEPEQEAEPEAEAEEPKEQVNSFMDTINNLVNEVKELKTSIYQKNINETEIVNRQDEAEQILASLINPLKKED